jgi:two-component system nitrate/nitrite response regulator NarL
VTFPARHLPQTRVVVADRLPLFREALSRVVHQSPSLRLEAEEAPLDDVAALLSACKPDVAVIDGTTGAIDVARVLGRLTTLGIGTRVIVLGPANDARAAYDLLALGAEGWLTRETCASEVQRAIAAVAAGRTYLATGVQDAVLGELRLRGREPSPQLSAREREILERVAQGESARAIGRAMHLSAATIKSHLGRVYDKLGVSERAAAVAVAMRRGLLD